MAMLPSLSGIWVSMVGSWVAGLGGSEFGGVGLLNVVNC
jgi:hypothetical protein